ncbi:MAG: sugar phosphate isomerase/epimerase [Deltaproteobacteria bacterium]|nr:sugar phosphate isomerase/epimerase [Deltaproteobacteria bacterium]
MLGPDDLVVTASTLGNPPLRTLVEAASAGGFAGLSIFPSETYHPAVASGSSPAELRSILDDHGVVVNDVDALVCTGDPGDAGAGGMGSAGEAMLFEAAEELRANFVNVVFMARQPMSVEQGAEIFAGVCDRAAEHGLSAYLEFVPFMTVPDAATAWAIVEQAGRPGSGIMVDSWHVFRGSTSEEELRAIPGERVLGIQLNDAPAEPIEKNMVEETLHHRLVPGEGDIDLVAHMRLLDEIGSPAPRCAEVFSDSLLASGTPEQISVRVGDALRAIRARARGSD